MSMREASVEEQLKHSRRWVLSAVVSLETVFLFCFTGLAALAKTGKTRPGGGDCDRCVEGRKALANIT